MRQSLIMRKGTNPESYPKVELISINPSLHECYLPYQRCDNYYLAGVSPAPEQRGHGDLKWSSMALNWPSKDYKDSALSILFTFGDGKDSQWQEFITSGSNDDA